MQNRCYSREFCACSMHIVYCYSLRLGLQLYSLLLTADHRMSVDILGSEEKGWECTSYAEVFKNEVANTLYQ